MDNLSKLHLQTSSYYNYLSSFLDYQPIKITQVEEKLVFNSEADKQSYMALIKTVQEKENCLNGLYGQIKTVVGATKNDSQ